MKIVYASRTGNVESIKKDFFDSSMLKELLNK